MDLDVRGVLAFLAVAEHGSFRGAARALGVPRSTLSQRLASLEERLGVELLARTTRSVRLTDAGVLYEREVAPAIAALSEADARIAERTVEPSGQLRVTAPFELGQGLFGPVLSIYAERYPAVRVFVDLIDRHVSLVDEGYDLAIRVGPLEDSQLIARRLGRPQGLGHFASQAYLDRAGPPKRPEELTGHRCLVMTGAQEPTQWSFASGRVTVLPAIAANSFVVLAHLTRCGAGIARPPRSYAADPMLQEVLAEHAPSGRALFAVYPSARHPSAALRAMIELVDEELVRLHAV